MRLAPRPAPLGWRPPVRHAARLPVNRAELVPLDAGDGASLGGTHDGPFGPLAALLVGYDDAAAAVVRDRVIRDDLEAADLIALLRASDETLASTLEAAFTGAPPAAPPLTTASATAIVVSGMHPAEVGDFVAAVDDAGVAPDLWCAAVPANWGDRTLAQLLLDIQADKEEVERQVAAGEWEG